MKGVCSPSRRTGLPAAVLAFFCLGTGTLCHGQGTMTIGFEGPPYTGGPSPQPPGTYTTIGGYSEAGMTFWNPYGQENLALVGPGLSGYADDGTAYLAITSGARLGYSFSSGAHFTVVSIDAADAYIGFPGTSLEAIGYKSMGVMVTNIFTIGSLADRRANNLPDFQTFYFSSQFQDVYRVDILTDRWALDNLVISGVPEPSCGALAVLAALCGLARAWARGRRTQ